MLPVCVGLVAAAIGASATILDADLIGEFFAAKFDGMGAIFHCEKSDRGLPKRYKTWLFLQRRFAELIPVAKRLVVFGNFRLSFNNMRGSDVDVEAVLDKNATMGAVMDGGCEEAVEYLTRVGFGCFLQRITAARFYSKAF